MMRNENMLILDLDKDHDDELIQARSIIQEVLKKRKQDNRYKLYTEAWGTGESVLIVLGAAMMLEHHAQISEVSESLPCEPTKQAIAYYIAKNRLAENPLTDSRQEKIRQKLMKSFDVISFVFDHTHYDECDNGYFYRRS